MINAKIIADSISPSGKRITTFELEYPRMVHSEFLTHRMLSRNAASSRAIPTSKMLSLVWNNPATPVHWGQNQSGMQANVELQGVRKWAVQQLWNISGKVACIFAWSLNKLKCHKQIVNRIVEPWSHIKVIVTATEWDNFFYLRNHPAAQPEIHELARQMWEIYKNNKPELLHIGEWHLPYIESKRGTNDIRYFESNGKFLNKQSSFAVVRCNTCSCVPNSSASDTANRELSKQACLSLILGCKFAGISSPYLSR